MKERVAVKVPATTANMGPGFDCLGMALDIWNHVTVEVGASGIEVSGEGADSLPTDDSNLVYQGFRTALIEAGRPVPQVRLVCRNEIPLGRGLGSSSAALIGGLVAGNELCGRPLDQATLLDLAANIEGHPDNVAPALLGGCQIGVWHDRRLVTSNVPVPDGLTAVIFIPEVEMATDDAREVLEDRVARQDAVYNIGRVAMLVRAMYTGDFSTLAIATDDRLHQPARQSMFPAMKNIFRAAIGAGALGVFLSGAGSSVLALAKGRELTIGYEMADAASNSGLNGTVRITTPTDQGAVVVEDSAA
jgi:homoserine kinase